MEFFRDYLDGIQDTQKKIHFKISYFEIYQDFRVFLLSLLKSFEITCVCQGDSK